MEKSKIGPKIIFDGVTKEYTGAAATVKALDNLSCTIDPGEFVFLMGHSGAGKSSFIKLLMLEERPTSGKIYVQDLDLSQINGKNVPYYRRQIGVVFQDFRLIRSKTVYENIAFAMEIFGHTQSTIRKRVRDVLQIVGLSKRMNELPSNLSGGEQQRVAIARAIVNGSSLIIADEPTGNLDPNNSREIMSLLEKINQIGSTVIVATHEEALAEKMGKRIIRLNHGLQENKAEDEAK